MTALVFGLASPAPAATEQWGMFEIALKGPAAGNPFIDVTLSARFSHDGRIVVAPGFYDGNGIYRIRFMPEQQGNWAYETTSNVAALDHKSGSLVVTPPSSGNHGPVHVVNTFHFAHADGAPYHELGTTAYAWIHQTDQLQQQTLKTLAKSPFNKMRMLVFPKHMIYNDNEPALYPYEGTAPNHWDFARFNPKFFQHLDKRVGQLRDIGIEADLILFHPYDEGHWGFDRMGANNNDRYVRYIVARLWAYRNVWWSMANEYNLVKSMTTSDWDRLFQIVQATDPAGHLRSIHNGKEIYDNSKPWVTHASVQNGSAVEDDGRAVLYRDVWRKPVVFDEVEYEGNIPYVWGSLSGEEMVHRFWEGLLAGSYVGHGETFLDPKDVIWWAKGGVLKGTSPSRLAFLRKVMEDGPPVIDPIEKWHDRHVAGVPGEYYIFYFGTKTPAQWTFDLPRGNLTGGEEFTAEILDTWNMTVTPIAGTFTTKKLDAYNFPDAAGRVIDLPGRQWIALRIRRVHKPN